MGIDSLIVMFLVIAIAAIVGLFVVLLVLNTKAKNEYSRAVDEAIKKLPKEKAPIAPPVSTPMGRAPVTRPTVTRTPAKPTPAPGGWVEPKKIPKEAPVSTNKVSIYEYRPMVRRCLCAHCDGENAVEATTCIICGQALN